MVVQKSIDPMTAQGYQLSPYTDVHGYMDDTLLLRRRDTEQSVLLSGADREDLMHVVEMLKQGTDIASIADWITSGDMDKARNWVDFLVQHGVLE